jgi:hypothetical protein
MRSDRRRSTGLVKNANSTSLNGRAWRTTCRACSIERFASQTTPTDQSSDAYRRPSRLASDFAYCAGDRSFALRELAMTMIIGSQRTSLRWSGIQESDAAGEFPIRAAPSRDPGLDSEKLEIPAREICTDPAEMTVLNRSHSVLWNARRHRDVANAAHATSLAAARSKRPPARQVFAASERLDVGKEREEGTPDLAIEQADLGRTEDRAGIAGQPLLQSSEYRRALHVRVFEVTCAARRAVNAESSP